MRNLFSRLISVTVIWFMVVVVASCGGVGKPSEVVIPERTPQAPLFAKEDGAILKAQIREGANPQAYSVALSWAGAVEASEAWTIYRDSPSRPRTFLGTLEKEKRDFLDDGAPPGETVSYLLIDGTSVENARHYRGEIKIPRDMVLSSPLSIKRLSGVHRLFLRSGAKVIGEDGQLEINVDQIISENAMVMTYADEDAAPVGHPGRSAEHLIIRANRGAGLLQVVARGQRAGAGTRGGDGENGRAGKPGQPCELESIFAFHQTLAEMAADQLWYKEEGPKYPATDHRWLTSRCSVQPGNGFDGEPGGKGSRGGVGPRGGNAGNILVEIANPAGFQVAPLNIGGAGGAGGLGGAGGKGGAGGPAGATDPVGKCHPANPGKAGPEGAAGEAGDPGQSGKSGLICLKLGAAITPDCDKIPPSAPYVW